MRRIQGELIHTNKFMQENLDKWRMSGKLGSERRIFSVPLDPHSVSFGESENQSQMLKGHLQYLIDSHSISWSHLCCLDLPLHPHSTPITSHSLVLSIPHFYPFFAAKHTKPEAWEACCKAGTYSASVVIQHSGRHGIHGKRFRITMIAWVELPR